MPKALRDHGRAERGVSGLGNISPRCRSVCDSGVNVRPTGVRRSEVADFDSYLAAFPKTSKNGARHRHLPNDYFLPFGLAGGSSAPTVEALGMIPGAYKPVS